jgi:hypothetical protein
MANHIPSIEYNPITGPRLILSDTSGVSGELFLTDSGQICLSGDVGMITVGSGFGQAGSTIQSIKTTTQELNLSGWSDITFDTDEFVTSGVTHVSGSAEFTIVSGGLYELSYNVCYDADSNRKNIRIAAFKDDTEIVPTNSYSYTRNNPNNKGSNTCPPFDIQIADNEVIKLKAIGIGDSGSALSIASQVWIKLKRIQ